MTPIKRCQEEKLLFSRVVNKDKRNMNEDPDKEAENQDKSENNTDKD